MPHRISNRRSAYNVTGAAPDSRQLRSWQMAEALGQNGPGNAKLAKSYDDGLGGGGAPSKRM